MEERPFTAASFAQFLGERKLMGSKCKKCGALYAPPRPICLKCYSNEMEWVELKGKGKLIGFTVIGVGPKPMVDAGYDREHHYCSGIIELEEGPKISAQVLGVDVTHPENIKIGTPLIVDFVERGKHFWGGELAKIKSNFPVFRHE